MTPSQVNAPEGLPASLWRGRNIALSPNHLRSGNLAWVCRKLDPWAGHRGWLVFRGDMNAA